MLRPFLAVLLLFFGMMPKSMAEFSVNGRLYRNLYLLTEDNDAYPSGALQSSFSAWLDVQGTLSQTLSVHGVFQGDGLLRSPKEPYYPKFSFQVREGFFSYQTESTEFRVGQQIIPWGKSDGVNPTDYFTSKNFTLLNPDDEVRRQGSPGILVNFTPKKGTSPFTFTAVFQSVYPQTLFLIPDQTTQAVPTGIQFVKYPERPDFFKKDSIEFGGKISFFQNNYDLSISAFRGVNHFPQYVYDFTRNLIEPIHIRQTALGGDASFTLGDWVIRAETAYFIPDNGNDGTTLYGLVQPTHWDSVVGVERSFFTNFRAQIQFLYRYHSDFLDPSLYTTLNPVVTAIQQAVARSNQLILNYQRSQNLGATFRFGYANDASPWTADAFLYGYFSQGQDYLLRLQTSYKVMEGLRLTTGSDLYGGNESRPLGALKKNSSVFFEGRYLF